MAGVRVQHPTVRNARFTVVEKNNPYRAPYQCTPPDLGGCGSTHLFKTHHLNVDETGSVIIGDILYQRIKHLLVLNGFTEQNVVQKPPPIGIVVGGGAAAVGLPLGNVPIVHGTE